MSGPNSTVIQVILAIILPPLAVYTVKGCGTQLLLNFVLLLLFVWPAIVHALYLIYVDIEHSERIDRMDYSGGSMGSWESRDRRGSSRGSREVHFE